MRRKKTSKAIRSAVYSMLTRRNHILARQRKDGFYMYNTLKHHPNLLAIVTTNTRSYSTRVKSKDDFHASVNYSSY